MRKFTAFLIVFAAFIWSQQSQAQDKAVYPTAITEAFYHDVYGPLRNIPPLSKAERQVMEIKANNKLLNPKLRTRSYPFAENALPKGDDAVWQKTMGSTKNGKLPILNFEGQTSPYYPPDANGAVGPNHYMQTVNTTYAIWNKAGTQVVAPTAMNTLFSGVPGSSNNDGDPLILFDSQADKWLAVEFSITGSPDYMLLAVSQTNDPTGSWDRWSFVMNGMPDYEKIGIWQDGYYMATNTSSGDDVYVFERDVMIAGGASPQMVQFNNPWVPTTIDGFHCILPLDNDGPFAPAGTPGLFITINDDAIGGGNDELWLYECDMDWTTPSSSTFNRTQQLTVSPFDSNFGNTWDNIVQPGTSQKLDAIPMVLMYRAQYRNFGTSQAIVCTHTVDLDATDHAGLRWYELENTAGTWGIRQQGTYGPDEHHRWMGSIAMNASHEIGLGYSISSSTIYPGIRYVGQSSAENALASGNLDITEEIIQTSSNSQTGANRWGDYANMSVDPSDDETFWFTTEYIGSGGSRKSKIASFQIGPAVLAANFTADFTQVEVGNAVQFTDLSSGPPTSWTWTFTGGTPSTFSGQNPPPVQYNAVGVYDVTLEVSDGSGTDIMTKSDYIEVINCGVSTFPFTEDFENGGAIPDCWTQEYISGNNVNWQFIEGNGGSNPSSAHSGSYNGCLKDESTSSDKSNLVTPLLDLSGFSTAWVTFWHTQEFWSPDQDELKVYYKTSASGSWNLLASFTSSIATWTKDSLDLPSINGSYYIAFEGNAQYGYGVCLDDVTVDGAGAVAIVADFTADPESGPAPLSVDFHDQSSGSIDTWDWDFGDGNGSTDQFPTHIYSTEGTYSVSLTVTGPSGSDTETKTDFITVSSIPAPITDFEGTPLSGTEPLEVIFTDLSVGDIDTWSWEFGDGEQSTEQNPIYTYNSYGLYTVALTTSGPGGNSTETKTDYIEVLATSPTADFMGDPTSGTEPLLVSFTDLSAGEIDTWTWEFGDGANSPEQNPIHEYTTAGVYTVTLSVSGPGGTDIMSKSDYILVLAIEAPVADFMGDPTFGEAPLQVTFNNQTTGEVEQYDWDFGDGGVSQDENPVHEYVTVGNYSVSLTATGPGGVDTETKVDYILIPVGLNDKPVAAYFVYPNPVSQNLQVVFPDEQPRQLTLRDENGLEVLQMSSQNKEDQLDMTNLPSGIYYLTIQENGEPKATVKVLRK